MTIFGGLALLGHKINSSLILFFVAMFNVVLFLSFYVAVIISFMMASGTTVPIRTGISESEQKEDFFTVLLCKIKCLGLRRRDLRAIAPTLQSSSATP